MKQISEDITIFCIQKEVINLKYRKMRNKYQAVIFFIGYNLRQYWPYLGYIMTNIKNTGAKQS